MNWFARRTFNNKQRLSHVKSDENVKYTVPGKNHVVNWGFEPVSPNTKRVVWGRGSKRHSKQVWQECCDCDCTVRIIWIMCLSCYLDVIHLSIHFSNYLNLLWCNETCFFFFHSYIHLTDSFYYLHLYIISCFSFTYSPSESFI